MSNTVITVVGAVWAGGAIAYSFLRRRGTPLALLEAQLHAQREELEQRIEYREPGAPGTGDDELVARTAQLAPALGALVALGFTQVATLVEQHPERQPRAIGTWLVDRAGTTAVCVCLPYSLARVAVELATVSASATACYQLPPRSYAMLAAPGALAAHVAKHAGQLPADVALLPLASRAAIVDALGAARERVRAWRHAQPPDVLLEHDVRQLLGARYAQLGPRLVARMTEQLPRATLRRA